LYTERASAIESIRPMTRCHAPTDVRLGASVWTAASSHGWAQAGIPSGLLSLCPLPERGLLGQRATLFPNRMGEGPDVSRDWGGSGSERNAVELISRCQSRCRELVAVSSASNFAECATATAAVPAKTPAAAGWLPPSHRCRPGTRRRSHIPWQGFVLPHSMTSSNRADNR
jgi:hypothetical protein